MWRSDLFILVVSGLMLSLRSGRGYILIFSFALRRGGGEERGYLRSYPTLQEHCKIINHLFEEIIKKGMKKVNHIIIDNALNKVEMSNQ